MPHLPSIPPNGTAFDIFTTFPGFYAPFVDFCEQVFRGEGTLTPKERETIFAYVSGLNACKYCFGGHSASAVALGLAPDAFDGLKDGIEQAPVDPKLKPLLAYAKKLNEAPTTITEADAKAVYDAGWDENALHGAITLCCMANFMNRLVEGCGIAADPALFEKRGEQAVRYGYRKPFFMKLEQFAKAARSG